MGINEDTEVHYFIFKTMNCHIVFFQYDLSLHHIKKLGIMWFKMHML
jgi:hypothetical protein